MTRLSRDDIVIGAGKRFASHGYHGTSMRDLGDDLGILGSSIYAHVGGKQELLLAVIDRGAELFAASADRAVAEGHNPGSMLRLLIEGHLAVLRNHSAEARTFLNEADFLDAPERLRVVKLRDEYEQVFRQAIADGIDDGTFRSSADVRLAAIYTLSMLNATQRWYDPAGRVGPDAVANDMYDFVVRGLTAD